MNLFMAAHRVDIDLPAPRLNVDNFVELDMILRNGIVLHNAKYELLMSNSEWYYNWLSSLTMSG